MSDDQAPAPQDAVPDQQDSIMTSQQAPAPINVMSPDGELGTIDPSEANDALQNGYSLATPEDIAAHKYSGAGEQIKAGLEGAAEGATFGLSTGLETAMGVNPEDIQGRATAYPITHGVGQVAGLIGSSVIPGVGEAGLLREAGQGAAEAVGLGAKGAGFVSQVGADTVKGAFEAALFQGGDEVSKAFAQDPNQSAETAIANIGLAGVVGGVFGGASGALLRKAGFGAALDAPGGAVAGDMTDPSFVSEVDRPALEAGDFKASIENSNMLDEGQKKSIIEGLREQKPDASDIIAAAKRLNAPVMEGMTSASRAVQKAEDGLLNGAPTYSGLKRQQLYGEGYKAANAAVEDALGDSSTYTKAELGNIMKSSISSQINEQAKPISAMYNYIKQYHNIIPLSEDAVSKISDELSQMPELRVAPSSPGANLIRNVTDEIGNLKTVDDIKTYRSSLYDRLPATASPGERRVAAIISDKLKGLEDQGVESFAKSVPRNDEARDVVSSLIDQRKTADTQYKPFIKKVQTLSEQLGKGKIHGAQDAIHFLNELTPEQVTQKLFAKNNSEFLKFFSKEFPEQMDLMRTYQKGVLREAASKSGELSPKLLFNKVNAMEPEIQKSLFSSKELDKLKDAETYIRAIPGSFNPSGTSGMSAFRQFFEHPTGAIVGNARDLAIEKFIKAFGGAPEVRNATKLASHTVSGWNTMNKAIKAALSPDTVQMPSSIISSDAARDKLSKLVDDYAQNPQKMTMANDNNPVPEYNQAFSATASRAVSYLTAQKPNTTKQAPLDTQREPSAMEKAKYNRALSIAQQPLSTLKCINDGSLTPQDITTLKTIYPNLYNQLCSRLYNGVQDAVNKGKSIPYARRLSLSMFLGQNLDSTMTPAGIMGAQPMPQQQPQMPQGAPRKPPSKASTAPLNKLSNQYQTPGQAAEGRRANKD